ncbi:MAG TPA: butyrate kinase [Thermotogaceae bacterium]|nr:butyrate kinase [Thermotogaceae bacterium]
MKDFKILVINPGSTSTKVAIFENDKCIFKKVVEHPLEELKKFNRFIDQYEMRKKAIVDSVEIAGYDLEEFDAIAARGGILEAMEGGTYLINENITNYLKYESKIDHASNLAPIIAHELSKEYNIPAFLTDPISVDEFNELARFSGIKEIQRKSLSHALNMKMVGRKVAEELGKSYEECNFVIAHIGGGISVSAHEKGRMIDVNNANDEGPFSAERTGELPVGDVVKLAFSGKYTKSELKRRYTKQGGLIAYLGTNNLKEVLERAEVDPKAKLIVKAMVLQIAKEIGGMCTVLKGKVDAIILTGGMTNNPKFVEMIKEYISKFSLVMVLPGEKEMEALALGALKVLRGEITPKMYTEGVKA